MSVKHNLTPASKIVYYVTSQESETFDYVMVNTVFNAKRDTYFKK